MEKDVLRGMFEEVGAIITKTHVVYTSGRHGSAYINKDALYPHTEITSTLCQEMAKKFRDENIDVVAGPTIGGVVLSQWVAFHLSKVSGKGVCSVYAEKGEDGQRLFKRGFDKLVKGKNVLVVEDILTTGGSMRKVVDAARNLKANVVGCVALCNRGAVTIADLGNVPRFETLIDIDFESWEESECPLCKKDIPIDTSIGKGREYLARTRK